MTHDFLQVCHQLQARKLFHDRIVLIPGQQATVDAIWPLEVGPDPVAAGLHLGLLVEDDGADGVQGDGVPDELHAMLIPVGYLAMQEIPSGIRSIDLEALVLRDELTARVPSDVVQQSGDGVDLEIAISDGGDLCGDDEPEEHGTNDVVVCEVIAVGASELECLGDERGIGD